ncbi:hypothetical protein IGI04_026458 [Brassica rapa subsp. trilocularis]|uniref:Reverse transcriptase zinc-binding domain-containing protein n=1 Tax=Brassica rapa subsp. trilocularis TaxID=1813537 RepID=A0ABQ7KWP8_BRACM|nr:hypothetical protein IGI04_026458 [Brassica rapa subsp. trilocularis]
MRRGFDLKPNYLSRYVLLELHKNGQYTIKYGYWIAQNILKNKEENVYSKSNITKFQVFTWRIKVPKKMCHFIWQLITGTRNIRRRVSTLRSEIEALNWAIESMLHHSTCQNFGTVCMNLITMIKEPNVWSNFSTELKYIKILKRRFQNILYFLGQSALSDSLAGTPRFFHNEFFCWLFNSSLVL